MTLDREQVKAALPAYEVGAEIGRGGWGVVLAARHRRLGREVAIKQLPRVFGADPAVRARFVAEARTLASLDHPHIVPVYDYVEADGLCLLVMENLPGGTLWSRFMSDGLTMESSCAIVLAACAGLHAAHQRGVLHRDVKPENLMFSAGGVLKVTDFGIAKVVGGGRTMATRAGEVLGTPSYMAPEHARGETLGPPADVYATGVVLYEVLSGRLPFSDEGDALAVLYRHVYESPEPLGDVAPEVPATIAAVVMKALTAQPDDRYPSAEAFGVALADAAGAAWGPGWASARTEVAVMGSAPIVSAIERSSSSSPPRPGKAPPTVVSEAVPAAATPAPRTAAVRPTAAASHRAAHHAPESAELLSLHEIAALDRSPGGGRGKGRRRIAALVAALVAGVAVIGGVVVFLIGGGDKGPATPATVPQPAAQERITFQDDFSSSASGWTQFDNETGRIGYVSGTYLVLVRQPAFRITSDTDLEGPAYRADLLALGDVAIEVDANRLAALGTEFGLLCHRGGGAFYMGVVDSAGQARIEKVAPDGQGSRLAEAPLDTAGTTGRRHMRMECVGGAGKPAALRLFVDGKLAVEANDPTPLGPGAAGLVVTSQDRPGSQVVFDNFVVKDVAAAAGGS